MKTKYFTTLILLAGASLFITSDAFAQRGGNPGGGRPPGGGGRPPGVGTLPPNGGLRPGGGFYPNAYGPYRGYGAPGISISIGGFPGGYPYGAGLYSNNYYAPNPFALYPYTAYQYSGFPAYYNPATNGPIVGGYDPSPVFPPSQPAPVQPAVQTTSAQIRVLVPDANAKVWFDGNATKQTGTERLFYTPDLAPGAKYTYRIRASWGGETQEIVVSVAPGGTATANFRDDAEPIPSK